MKPPYVVALVELVEQPGLQLQTTSSAARSMRCARAWRSRSSSPTTTTCTCRCFVQPQLDREHFEDRVAISGIGRSQIAGVCSAIRGSSRPKRRSRRFPTPGCGPTTSMASPPIRAATTRAPVSRAPGCWMFARCWGSPPLHQRRHRGRGPDRIGHPRCRLRWVAAWSTTCCVFGRFGSRRANDRRASRRGHPARPRARCARWPPGPKAIASGPSPTASVIQPRRAAHPALLLRARRNARTTRADRAQRPPQRGANPDAVYRDPLTLDDYLDARHDFGAALPLRLRRARRRDHRRGRLATRSRTCHRAPTVSSLKRSARRPASTRPATCCGRGPPGCRPAT